MDLYNRLHSAEKNKISKPFTKFSMDSPRQSLSFQMEVSMNFPQIYYCCEKEILHSLKACDFH
jgi:hypothetical protein